MLKKLTLIIFTLGLAGVLVFLVWGQDYFASFQKTTLPGDVITLYESSSSEETDPTIPWTVEPVVMGLEVPWSIAWTSPDRMLVTERPGKLRIIENGNLLPEPLYVFSEVSSRAEEGLMGLAIDPNYAANRYIYLSYAYQPSAGNYQVKVVRFVDGGDTLSNETVLLDNIPAARFHAGSRLRFGPEGKLYITTGDATDKNIAQDLGSLGGKILRMNPDGSIPTDNPFPDSYVWSYGHRNPQGIDWHPLTNNLYSTEHGPSIFDGPAGGDEVNYIVSSGNYGWPLVSHEETREGTISPSLVFTPAEAPGSGIFYDSDTIPQWENDYFFGALKGEGIIRIRFSPQKPEKVVEFEKIEGINYGRIREVALGPDGNLYFTTSNRDGRGNASADDDMILRIIPQ
jgi:glucose/arabinose dehydrogenase